MRNICIAFAILASVLFSQPSFAECGSYNRVEYVRSSQRDRGTDFRLKVQIDESVASNAPVVDVKTTLVDDGGSVLAYSFVLNNGTFDERTETTYTRIRLTQNSDGTSTLRVAMRVPYTVYNGGLGYYASIRSCE